MRQITNCYPSALHQQRGDVRWRCSSGTAHPDIKPIPVPLPNALSRAGLALELPVYACRQPCVLASAPFPPSPIPLHPTGQEPSLSPSLFPSRCLCSLQLHQLIKDRGCVPALGSVGALQSPLST